MEDIKLFEGVIYQLYEMEGNLFNSIDTTWPYSDFLNSVADNLTDILKEIQ